MHTSLGGLPRPQPALRTLGSLPPRPGPAEGSPLAHSPHQGVLLDSPLPTKTSPQPSFHYILTGPISPSRVPDACPPLRAQEGCHPHPRHTKPLLPTLAQGCLLVPPFRPNVAFSKTLPGPHSVQFTLLGALTPLRTGSLYAGVRCSPCLLCSAGTPGTQPEPTHRQRLCPGSAAKAALAEVRSSWTAKARSRAQRRLQDAYTPPPKAAGWAGWWGACVLEGPRGLLRQSAGALRLGGGGRAGP